MSIYTKNGLPVPFVPTSLYIKRHNATGLMYFGKTSNNPLTYPGSGRYWKKHLRHHGNNVTTLWHCLFESQEDLVEFALFFSEVHDIVGARDANGKKIWANEVPENGLDGSPKGLKRGPQTAEHRKKNSDANAGSNNPMYGVKRPEGLMRKAGMAGLKAQKRLIETNPEFAKLHEQRQMAFREAGRKALSKREDGTSVSSDMVANGTHNFLGGSIQSASNQRRLKDKTHHLLGGAQQRQQLANGLHPSQIKISCVECRKVLSGVANLNQHARGSKCKKYHE